MNDALSARRRGDPLVVLGGIVGLWIALRVVFWQPFVVAQTVRDDGLPFSMSALQSARSGRSETHKFAVAGNRGERSLPASPRTRADGMIFASGSSKNLAVSAAAPVAPDVPSSDLGPTGYPRALYGAASPLQAERGDRSDSRWSADGWFLLRGGQGSGPGGAAGYGGDQAGAVVRYALRTGDRKGPALYARLSRSIAAPDSDYRELAGGLSFRPVRTWPVAVLVEARLRQSGDSQRQLRPAIAAVTQLPPQQLPLELVGELYGQAGYVGGKQSTGFFDLQAIGQRKVAAVGARGSLHFGGGLWAGGQRGAARLDIGPGGSARVSVGEAAARISLDWRLRVAGNAAPGSGPVLSVSAGF